MTKDKVTIGFRIKHCFTYHPWLKLIALALAIMLWSYVNAEIRRF
jgi:hypothetical protein